jgi:hypothetical protein
MKHPVSHLVAHSDLELRDEGVAHLATAKAQLAGDHAPDASSSLDAAFEDCQEIQNRNAENWQRGPSVAVAAELADTCSLTGRVAEQAAFGRSDLGWADDFYRRAAEQVTPNRSFYHEEWGAFCARAA